MAFNYTYISDGLSRVTNIISKQAQEIENPELKLKTLSSYHEQVLYSQMLSIQKPHIQKECLGCKRNMGTLRDSVLSIKSVIKTLLRVIKTLKKSDKDKESKKIFTQTSCVRPPK